MKNWLLTEDSLAVGAHVTSDEKFVEDQIEHVELLITETGVAAEHVVDIGQTEGAEEEAFGADLAWGLAGH